MYLKLKAYCLGVPLLYTLSTINLSSLVRCEHTAHSFQPTSRSAPHNVRSGVLTTRVPSDPSTTAAGHLAYFSGPRRQNLEGGSWTTTKLPGLGSKRGIGAKMASSSSLAPRYKRGQTEGERLFTSHEVLDGNCSRGTIRRVVPGNFYVTGQLEANPRHGGHQSDSAATGETPGFCYYMLLNVERCWYNSTSIHVRFFISRAGCGRVRASGLQPVWCPAHTRFCLRRCLLQTEVFKLCAHQN